jgi:phenazine biosynthesis protein PhzF family protein
VYKILRPSGAVGFREVGWQRCTGEISDADVSRYRFFPEKRRRPLTLPCRQPFSRHGAVCGGRNSFTVGGDYDIKKSETRPRNRQRCGIAESLPVRKENQHMKFQIVDAFTRQTFGGNPAGVVLLPEGAEFPADETMRKTAAELRYSETAFIKPLGGNRFHIRYFTPAAEVELCGHATIGSFHALQEMGLVAEGGTYIDETLSGTLEVVVGKDAILMDMAKPQAFQRLETPEELEELYRIMGLSAGGQGAVTGKPELMLLPQKVSTGLTDIMMPVADEAELEKIAPDFPALTEHSRRYNVVGVHAFTVNTADGMIRARNFAPLYDIDEEAATGTSNGALVYYLYRHGLVELDKVYTVVQGEKMGRPSMISAQVILKDGLPFVKVGGPAVTLVRGEIDL